MTVFRNHAILMVDDKFYDPSYGGDAHNNRASWEAASLAGTKAKRIVDPQAAIPQYFVAVKKNVDNGADEQDVKFIIIDGVNNNIEVGN